MDNGFGSASFKWYGGRAPWVVRSAIADGMERAALNIKRSMKRRINRPYPPASRPGQSPRRRSGTLYRSIQFWINRKTLEMFIGPDASSDPYNVYLETGTSKMEPRPYIFRAMKDEMKRTLNTINRAAAMAFNRYAKQGGK